MSQSLRQKIENKTAIIGIVGLGYVGLPLVERFLSVGLKVIGFDNDKEKINSLCHGESYIEHIKPEPLFQSYQNGFFSPTTDYSLINTVDTIILCLPTPLNKNREPDISFIVGTTQSIIHYLRQGQLISLESTTYPGTTEEVLRPLLEQAGFVVGDDIFLVYSPEREDPGNPIYKTQNIPKVRGGCSQRCLQAGVALYQQIIDEVIPVSSTQSAETTKILENTFRAVNIALVNELKMVSDKMDLDIFEVIRTAATKPFGYMPFFPGPGLGGHCIPIDPFYLTWKAREYGITTKFIELAGEINTSMPDYVISKLMEALNSHSKPLRDSRVLILGVAYKKNVDDKRESPALELIEKMQNLGALVEYSDPHVPQLTKMRRFDLKMSSIEITHSNLSLFDCVLIVTEHEKFDWNTIYDCSRLIVDTRGIFKADKVKVFRA